MVVSTISATARVTVLTIFSRFQFSRFGATANYSYTAKISGITVVHVRTWWSLLTIESLYSWLPSTMPVRGLENHSLKSLCEENTVGMRKCIKDHSSIRLFWSGVPVNSSLRWLLKVSSVCHLWLLKFFMFWAWIITAKQHHIKKRIHTFTWSQNLV